MALDLNIKRANDHAERAQAAIVAANKSWAEVEDDCDSVHLLPADHHRQLAAAEATLAGVYATLALCDATLQAAR